MQTVQELVDRALRVAEATNRSPSTVSRLIFGGGQRLSELAEGKSSVSVDVFHRASAKLDEMEQQDKGLGA